MDFGDSKTLARIAEAAVGIERELNRIANWLEGQTKKELENQIKQVLGD